MAEDAEPGMVDGKGALALVYVAHLVSLVIILFKNAGSAPQLQQRKFKLKADSAFTRVTEFLREQLHLKPTDPLFLFVNSTFQPSPETTVGDLYKCFHVSGKLVVNYCLTPAWG